MSSVRKGRGRQKINMKKMSNKSNMQVTFSRRRSGLFKKASELCTLCDTEIVLVVFSPSEKVFSFGHPNIDIVIDRYLSQVPPQNNDIIQFINARRRASACELNAQLAKINNTLDVEKKLGDELSLVCKEAKTQFWGTCSIDRMNWAQLEIFKMALEELGNLVAIHVDRLVIHDTPTQIHPFLVDNVSSSNIGFQHQLNPQQGQMFSSQSFQNQMWHR
ncbi:agamous-like MADS-box protein AGL62 [Vicia villosa]|uniref:agamous-like MADS-box protein AGL62 n=1 Tax=Vicia villosa TaxID=3911 RepID=UPI00273C020D|nr:agamous-like MADS-box protein AGL62 [Vicia villosa]